MKIYELYEEKLDETRGETLDRLRRQDLRSVVGDKDKITLRDIRKIAAIRRRRRRQEAEKSIVLQAMYGDPELREAEREQAQQALDQIKDDKDHVEAMAMREVERRRKA